MTSVEPSEQLAGIFEHIKKDNLIVELQPKDLIEVEEFERIWDSKSQEQVMDSIS